MGESLFLDYVKRYFKPVVLRFVQELNGSKNPLPYLHTALTEKVFSVTGQWDSVIEQNQLVRADYVAMDSALPQKSRGIATKVGGDIPKVGIEKWLNEKQLTDLQTLIAIGGTEAQIVKSLFADTRAVIGGQYETNEGTFLKALSDGKAVIETENVGTSISVDYGYFDENKFGAKVVWSNGSTADPIEDLKRVKDKAHGDGNVPQVIYMDATALSNLIKADAFKERYSISIGSLRTSNYPTPGEDEAIRLLKSLTGMEIVIVNRSIRYEINGKVQAYKPWADGRVILAPAGKLGSLVYARLAEEGAPVAGVSYQKADEYILVSKFRDNRPLTEFTTSQSRSLPVITNVDQIYSLDTKVAQS